MHKFGYKAIQNLSEITHILMGGNFLAEPDVLVLCARKKKGVYRPIQEWQGGVLCHLSLIDAIIEQAHLRRLGRPYHVMSAGLVQRDAFLDAEGVGYIAHVHLGWPARDGKLLTRPNGALASYQRTLHVRRARAPAPHTFQIDEDSVSEVNRIRERAGIFAWEETMALMVEWGPQRIARIGNSALRSLELERGDASQIQANQLALFDPDFEQWHYIPWSWNG
ncbi:hypothetical protein DWU98_19425 [Dyella monticola]|uniref:Uncharacterized protein n=2 Tax=Dyella monticola TaxID=1927958 RepID=A0A370WSE9_9GAMM|nr:hypothetical protein DWU98_19425 [Dyella monticola]